MTPVPLAYKFVAIAVMLAEINHSASRLQLPVDLPIKESDVKIATVSNPHVITRVRNLPIEHGFAGGINTEKYSFNFIASGRLRYITRLDGGYQAFSTTKVQGDLPTSDYLPQLAGIQSVIDTNGAYRLATNWLVAMDVDVQRLEKEQAVTVKQEFGKGSAPLPIFEVRWGVGRIDNLGHPKSAAVDVMIAGDTKDLLHLRQNDDSYSKRPFVLIKDMDKLLAIPDEEFLKYSPMERSNLVARFAAVVYPVTTNAPTEDRK